MREFLNDEFPMAAMVSEWGEPDKSLQGGFHMDFLLHFGPSHYNDLFRCEEPFFSDRGKGDVSAFVAKYLENYEKAERKGLICIPSGECCKIITTFSSSSFNSGNNCRCTASFFPAFASQPMALTKSSADRISEARLLFINSLHPAE